MSVKNFAITGVSGYIAPRHLRAIAETGNRIIAATDPNDSVGLLDQYSFDVEYFPEIERFDRHLEMLRRRNTERRVDYLTICSPNYLHDAHCRLGIRADADVICEKPIVINPWNLDLLSELERESGRRVFTVLQLRLHPKLVALKAKLATPRSNGKHLVDLTYITSRGSWYNYSWKGQPEKSGGLATNIGIHFFDLLLWIFGKCESSRIYRADSHCVSGSFELASARVRWFLSIDSRHLPVSPASGKSATFRSLTVDGEAVEFSDGFADLHTRVYQEILAGKGFGIEEARASIELAHNIRHAGISPMDEMVHPTLTNLKEPL